MLNYRNFVIALTPVLKSDSGNQIQPIEGMSMRRKLIGIHFRPRPVAVFCKLWI